MISGAALYGYNGFILNCLYNCLSLNGDNLEVLGKNTGSQESQIFIKQKERKDLFFYLFHCWCSLGECGKWQLCIIADDSTLPRGELFTYHLHVKKAPEGGGQGIIFPS